MDNKARNSLLLALIVAGILGVFPASAATVTISKHYESGGAISTSRSREDPTCKSAPPCRVAKDGRVEAGGVSFPALGGKARKLTMTIHVVDDVNATGKVNVGVCEDSSGSLSCGTDDRYWNNYCAGPKDAITLRNVSSANAVLVYVTAAAYSCTRYVNVVGDEAPLVATSGTITLSYKK